MIAQLVEQSAVNRSVVGSSPTHGAIFFTLELLQAVPVLFRFSLFLYQEEYCNERED